MLASHLLAQDVTVTDDPDRALVQRMAGGDGDAHRALYEAYGRDVLAYLIGRLGDPSVAEELLHDVMLSAWRGAAAFRGASRVRTWLLTIAHNAACNELRRRQRLTVVPSIERVDGARSQFDGRRAGARLDDRIDLVFAHGLAQEEAADVLGIAVGTVKSRLNRAKERLRRHLADREAPDGGHHA